MADIQTIIDSIRRVQKHIRITGVVLIVLGLLAIFAPQVAGMTVSVVFGVLLLLAGILRTAFAFFSAAWGGLFWRAGTGVLTIIAGGYLIAKPDDGASVLTILLIAYMLIDGVTTLIFGLQFPPALGGAWIVAGSLASILLGVLLWMNWPASGEMGIGLLLGIKLVIDGIELFAVGNKSARYAN